ncbi:MAG: LemA family protein [Bacteroidales bacterium]|jgi:LemA protein
MKRTVLILGIVILLLILLIGKGIRIYNDFIVKQEAVKTSWGNVQNAYQKRFDLIPNLVNTVKGYADHEQSTLIGVIEARAEATKTSINVDADKITPETLAEINNLTADMNSVLSRLLVAVERYPDLKANENFLQLQRQLETTENEINARRNEFNETAKIYNTKVRRFPNNIVAAIFKFKVMPYFESIEGAEVAPVVDFSK